MKIKKLAAIAIAATILALGPVTAANAEGTATSSCTAGNEICTVTHSNVTSSTVTLRTTSASNGSLVSWSLRKNSSSGAALCSGSSFSYNTSKTCNIGTYRGKVVMVSNKTYQPAVTVSITG